MPLHKIVLDASGIKYLYLDANKFKTEFNSLLNNTLPAKYKRKNNNTSFYQTAKGQLAIIVEELNVWAADKGVNVVLQPGSIHTEKELFKQRIVYEIMKILSEIEFNTIGGIIPSEKFSEIQNRVKALSAAYGLFRSREEYMRSRLTENIFPSLSRILQINLSNFENLPTDSLSDAYASIIDKIMSDKDHDKYVSHFISVTENINTSNAFEAWKASAPGNVSREYQSKVQKITFEAIKNASTNGQLTKMVTVVQELQKERKQLNSSQTTHLSLNSRNYGSMSSNNNNNNSDITNLNNSSGSAIKKMFSGLFGKQ